MKNYKIIVNEDFKVPTLKLTKNIKLQKKRK